VEPVGRDGLRGGVRRKRKRAQELQATEDEAGPVLDSATFVT
jgi:hypothetical protein